MEGAAKLHVIVADAVNPFATNESVSVPTAVPVEQNVAIPRESDVALVDDAPETPEIVASTRTPSTGVPLLSKMETGTQALCPTTPFTFEDDSDSDATFARGEVFAPPVYA